MAIKRNDLESFVIGLGFGGILGFLSITDPNIRNLAAAVNPVPISAAVPQRAAAASWSFGAVGDDDDETIASNIATRIATTCDKFVGLGDYSENGKTNYLTWLNKIPMAKRLVATYGNHDVDEKVPFAPFGIQSWNQSVSYGGVTFANMNGESHTCADAAAVAAGKARGDWIIGLSHEPIYTCPNSQHGPDEGGLSKCLPPLLAAGMKLCLAGHVHDYERLCVGGLTYVVVGTLASSDYGVKKCAQACGPTLDKVPGFLKVNVTPRVLTCQFIDQNGGVRDTFTITR